jgi:hypothetical protein
LGDEIPEKERWEEGECGNVETWKCGNVEM